jgi:hypothetical protein
MTTTCERKTRYATLGLATKTALRRAGETGDVIQAYPCGNCGGYHIGHPYRAMRGAGRKRGGRR